jgi:hypothetical protein
MNNNKRVKILLAIFISALFVLSSSVMLIGPSQSPATVVTPYVATTHNITFKETGLASATQWNVTLNLTSNTSMSMISNTTTIVFAELNGSYNYTINTVSGYTSSPTNGDAILTGANVTENITFTKIPTTSLAPINLGTAGNYTILSKTGISTTGTTSITGNIGVSPAAASYITGFGLVQSTNNQYATSSLVNGKVYAADYSPPTPANLTTAVGDMQVAYTTAAGITDPNYVNLGAGDISGMTLVPGLYKWSTGLLLTTSVTLKGNASSVWIFQVSGAFTLDSGAHIILAGGAQPQNIFWQVASGISIGTGAVFSGIAMTYKAITIDTGATLNGRAFSQTAVTLDANDVTPPAYKFVPIYKITFNESGLPTGTPWYVNVTNSTSKTTTSSLQVLNSSYTVAMVNGNYTYSVGTVNKLYHANNGSFTLAAKPISKQLTFSQVKYNVTMGETGLPTGTTWYLNLTNSTGGVLHFKELTPIANVSQMLTNGSDSFIIQSGNKSYTAQPNVVNFTVNGKNLTVPKSAFLIAKYSVTFHEKGLPSGKDWYVNITNTSSSLSIVSGPVTWANYTVSLFNGSYTYKIQTSDILYNTINKTGSITVTNVGSEAINAPFVSKPAYNLTFKETVLSTGTTWNLTFNGNTYTLTNTSYSFMVINGTYSYNATSKGYHTISKNVTVAGASRSITLNFTVQLTYKLTFSETGLLTGTTWKLAFNGTVYTLTNTSYSFMVLNGAHSYNASSIDYTNISSSVTVNNASQSVKIPFVLQTYNVTLTESGLPTGTSWNLAFDGSTHTLTNTSYSFMVVNGTYSYKANSTDYTNISNSVTVNGTNQSPTIYFVLQTYNVTFRESGLSSGTSWNLTFNGSTRTLTNTSYSFMLVNGTYTYNASSTDYANISNSVTVNGTNQTVPILFFLHGYKVTFRESGLPSGTSWNLTFSNNTYTLTSTSHSFMLSNGTYTYKATSTDYTTISNSVTVNGTNQSPTIYFVLQTYTITFTETGLPSGVAWYVNITGHDSGKITTSTYSVSLVNGTYTYTVGTGYHNYTVSGGKITVNGHAFSKSIAFAKKPAKANDNAYIIAAVVVVAAVAIGSAALIMRKK